MLSFFKNKKLNFAQITKRLPHGEEIIMLERIVESDKYSLTAQIRKITENPFLINNKLYPSFAVEAAAQAAAIHYSLFHFKAMKKCYLLNIKNLQSQIKHLNPNDDFIIKINAGISDGILFTYDLILEANKKKSVTGTITLYKEA